MDKKKKTFALMVKIGPHFTRPNGRSKYPAHCTIGFFRGVTDDDIKSIKAEYTKCVEDFKACIVTCQVGDRMKNSFKITGELADFGAFAKARLKAKFPDFGDYRDPHVDLGGDDSLIKSIDKLVDLTELVPY